MHDVNKTNIVQYIKDNWENNTSDVILNIHDVLKTFDEYVSLLDENLQILPEFFRKVFTVPPYNDKNKDEISVLMWILLQKTKLYITLIEKLANNFEVNIECLRLALDFKYPFHSIISMFREPTEQNTSRVYYRLKNNPTPDTDAIYFLASEDSNLYAQVIKKFIAQHMSQPEKSEDILSFILKLLLAKSSDNRSALYYVGANEPENLSELLEFCEANKLDDAVELLKNPDTYGPYKEKISFLKCENLKIPIGKIGSLAFFTDEIGDESSIVTPVSVPYLTFH